MFFWKHETRIHGGGDSGSLQVFFVFYIRARPKQMAFLVRSGLKKPMFLSSFRLFPVQGYVNFAYEWTVVTVRTPQKRRVSSRNHTANG